RPRTRSRATTGETDGHFHRKAVPPLQARRWALRAGRPPGRERDGREGLRGLAVRALRAALPGIHDGGAPGIRGQQRPPHHRAETALVRPLLGPPASPGAAAPPGLPPRAG